MEAICFFKPWNGSLFPCGPVAEWLSSLPGFRRAICRFDALNPVGRFSTPVPEPKNDTGGRSASDVVRRVGLGGLAGHRSTRPPVLGSHDASGGTGSPSGCVWDCPPCALRARQGCEDQSMTGICRRCHHIRGRGRTRRRVNPGFRSLSGATAADRGARPAARSMPHRHDSRRRRRG